MDNGANRQFRATAPSNAVTIDDLRSGRRARVTERELSMLIGKSVYTLQRDRWKRKGLPYQKDENGRIWYTAVDVLSLLDAPTHKGTNEYATERNVEHLAKARSAPRRRSRSAG
jgi:hypothetical protein